MDTLRLPELELRPSLRLGVLLAAAHGVAMLLFWMLPVVLPVKGLAAVVLLASAVWTIRRHVLHRGSAAVRALRFENRETVHMRRSDGHWQPGHIVGSSTVGPWLTVLNIEYAPRASSHVVLLGDELDAEDLRRLRLWLRWGPAAPADEDTR